MNGYGGFLTFMGLSMVGLASVTADGAADWGKFIGNVGVPTAVAFFLLVRIEPVLNRINQSLTLLSVLIARQGGLDYHAVKKEFQNGGTD